jgi:cytoskeletal protein CcmA (bactofilin family)
VLASGAKFVGTLTVEDSVRVEGDFTGEVLTNATLEIAQGGELKGKIQASFVTIAGSFEGDIRCEGQVALLPDSHVKAEIVTRGLTVAEGALFDGQIQMATHS